MPYAVPIKWCEVKNDKGEYCKGNPTHIVDTDKGGFFICTQCGDAYKTANYSVREFKKQ